MRKTRKALLWAVAVTAAAQSETAPPAPPPNQHGHTIGRQAAYLIESDEPMVKLTPAEELLLGFTSITLPLPDGSTQVVRVSSNPRAVAPKYTSTVPSATFETWVEDAYADYVESSSSGSDGVEKAAGRTTFHRYVRDDRRGVWVSYQVAIEVLPEAGTYRISFPEGSGLSSIPARNLRAVTPSQYPFPQIVHDLDRIRLELYLDPRTGQRLVDYIQVGPLNQLTPRTEAPHDSYADDAEFSLSRPRLKTNGVAQGSAPVPDELRGPLLWVYIPGHGRYWLSYKPPADPAAGNIGEVNGNALTFTDGGNIFRIECADRIAAGSGSYMVHITRDPEWAPADSNDARLTMLGVRPIL